MTTTEDPELMTRSQYVRFRERREMEGYEAMAELYEASVAKEAAERASRNKPSAGQMEKTGTDGSVIYLWRTFSSGGGRFFFWASCLDAAREVAWEFVGDTANAYPVRIEDVAGNLPPFIETWSK